MERVVPRDQLYELRSLMAEIQLIELQARNALQDKMRRRDEILGMWEQILQGRVESVDFEKGTVQIGTTDIGNPQVVGAGDPEGRHRPVRSAGTPPGGSRPSRRSCR